MLAARRAAALTAARTRQQLLFLVPRRALSSSAGGGEPLPKYVVAEESGEGRVFLNRLSSKGHVFLADEPKTFPGGTDFGPDPYSLLCGSIAACTNITVRLIANREGIPLDSVLTKVRHSRIYAKDCSDCMSKEGQVDEFERIILLKGDALTDENKKRLLAIADTCPIHKTITTESKIRTTMVA